VNSYYLFFFWNFAELIYLKIQTDKFQKLKKGLEKNFLNFLIFNSFKQIILKTL